VGYNTEFAGQVAIVPPLNPYEVEYLDRFAETRHEWRAAGPYAVSGNGLDTADMYGGEKPPPELPGRRSVPNRLRDGSSRRCSSTSPAITC
jgi:hypothetical protein